MSTHHAQQLVHRRRHVSPRIDYVPIRFRAAPPRNRWTDQPPTDPPDRGPWESGEQGFSTAELLGNAALGIAALVAIWVVLEALGVSVVAWIGAQLGVS